MHIETDQYLITSDTHNFILQLKIPRKDSEFLKDKSRIGEAILSEKRFYPSLVQLFSGLARLTLLSAQDIQDMQDIKDVLKGIKQEAKRAATQIR